MKMKERYKLLIIVAIFAMAYFIPWSDPVIRRSGLEAFMMLQEYAREHVLTCLIPAFFIAGAIAVFVSQASVLKYFGAKTRKILSYSVASISGTVLAVCSCTVLPLFAGIYSRGAGIGPAHCISLFRSGHQRAGNCAYGQNSRLAARTGQSHRRGAFCRNNRSSDVRHIPQG